MKYKPLPIPPWFPDWRLSEIEAYRKKLEDPRDVREEAGLLYWTSVNRLVPPFVFREDAFLECPPNQVAAYEKSVDEELSGYGTQSDREPSEEELFEMRAAFGPGKVIENVLTGQKYRT